MKTDIPVPADPEGFGIGSPQLKQSFSLFVRIPLHDRQRFMPLFDHSIAFEPITRKYRFLQLGQITGPEGYMYLRAGTS